MKNPFRSRYLVIGGIEQKASFLQVLYYFLTKIPFQAFDTAHDAQDCIKFKYDKLTQHKAVTYLMSSKNLTVEKLADKIYKDPNITHTLDQETFEINLTYFISKRTPLSYALSSYLERFFNLKENQLFHLDDH